MRENKRSVEVSELLSIIALKGRGDFFRANRLVIVNHLVNQLGTTKRAAYAVVREAIKVGILCSKKNGKVVWIKKKGEKE